MAVSFTTIYMLTYNNTEEIIDKMFKDVSQFKPFREDFEQLPPPVEENPSKRLIAFSVQIDNQNHIIDLVSTFDAEDNLYEALTAKALSNLGDGEISDGDVTWAYRYMERDNLKIIHFIDITTHVQILDKLIITFALVSSMTLIFIIIASNFLTNESIKPIQEAFDKQNTFISDASHELKTPLAVIQSNTEVLMRKPGLEEEMHLKFIQDETIRMKQLTENLLDLSRLDFEPHKQLELINLSECYEGKLLNLESLAFEANLKLDYDLEPNITLLGHKNELIQVFMILMDNAIKYSTNSIHVSLIKSHQNVILTVKNSGEDIPTKDKELIFDRFYKVDHARTNSSGYGLGLSIAKSIVSRHKGKINYKYQDHMNTFIIKIPTI